MMIVLQDRTPELQWWVIYTLLKTYSNKIVKSLRVAFNMLSALLAWTQLITMVNLFFTITER